MNMRSRVTADLTTYTTAEIMKMQDLAPLKMHFLHPDQNKLILLKKSNSHFITASFCTIFTSQNNKFFSSSLL